MRILKSTKKICFVVIFLISSMSFASSANQITFPDDVDDEGPHAPIDGFVIVGLAAGAYLGMRRTARTKQNTKL